MTSFSHNQHRARYKCTLTQVAAAYQHKEMKSSIYVIEEHIILRKIEDKDYAASKRKDFAN